MTGNHGKSIVYAAGDESDKAAISRYIKKEKHDQERLKYFVVRFYNTARRRMAKALGEGKIIVYSQEGKVMRRLLRNISERLIYAMVDFGGTMPGFGVG